MTDWNTLDAPTFFALASRTFAYMGVMASRAMKEQQDEKEPKPIENTAAQKFDPVLSELVEWG